MKHAYTLLFIFFFTFSFLGYTQEPTKMRHVVEMHDEVMAKMPELVKLIGRLQPRVDSTKTGQIYQKAIDELKAGNTSMMNWMRGFGEHFTANEMMKGTPLSEQKKIWLLEDEKKIIALRIEIDSGIVKAKNLLDN